MQKHICSLQISRICGAHALSVDHLAALYTALSLHYEHGMSAFGMESLPTDFGSSDAYALLAGELGLVQYLFKNQNHFKFSAPINLFVLKITRNYFDSPMQYMS